MRATVLLMLLAACHQNCGDNGGAAYAHFLDERAQCWPIRQADSEPDDYALCDVGLDETWLCRGEGWCRPLGPRVRVERVRP